MEENSSFCELFSSFNSDRRECREALPQAALKNDGRCRHFYLCFIQVLGAKVRSRGNISNLPNSIATDSTSLLIGL